LLGFGLIASEEKEEKREKQKRKNDDGVIGNRWLPEEEKKIILYIS